jgi:hypothetical protein
MAMYRDSLATNRGLPVRHPDGTGPGRRLGGDPPRETRARVRAAATLPGGARRVDDAAGARGDAQRPERN